MAELSTIARPYAEALFAVAQGDASGLDAWSEMLAGLSQAVALDDVRDALGDPRLSDAQRVDLLSGLVKTSLPQAAKNFVALLVDNDRIQALPQVAEQFEVLKNRQAGTALAEIASAFPLDDAKVQELVVGLEKKFGLKLKPVVTVDASLIGGVRVTVGDQVLDTSVRAQLTRLRDTLAA